ncbi:MAG: hypothetical protein IKU14_07165 [Rhodocyclaceae bacterium]|nr:hypothetical protein [Rhodocyclaceae bacterium]
MSEKQENWEGGWVFTPKKAQAVHESGLTLRFIFLPLSDADRRAFIQEDWCDLGRSRTQHGDTVCIVARSDNLRESLVALRQQHGVRNAHSVLTWMVREAGWMFAAAQNKPRRARRAPARAAKAPAQRMKSYGITLDEDTFLRAKALGDGSASRGIRRLFAVLKAGSNLPMLEEDH